MKRYFWLMLSFCFPWSIQLMDDNPGAAIVSAIMQVTIIGWPFAFLWAWGIAKHYVKNDKNPNVKVEPRAETQVQPPEEKK